ncbi:MAG: hypothetical protein WC325_08215 [Candidatus Bathyarchaeia archaeon]|jgi:hypothetical protein
MSNIVELDTKALRRERYLKYRAEHYDQIIARERLYRKTHKRPHRPKKARRHYLKYRDEICAKAKVTRKRDRVKRKKYEQQYRQKYRVKHNAGALARYNIPIKEGQVCEICKTEKATIRHHPDYTQPLLVQFLCAGCHKNLHISLKKVESQEMPI